MKKTVSRFSLSGFLFVSVFGVILHFLYGLTGENPIAAVFSAVNESTWEHMKLIFFPMLIFAFIERIFLSDEYKNFWCVKLIGTLIALILIPILFYTLNGAFGKTPDFVNIIIFFVSAFLGYLIEARLTESGLPVCSNGAAALLLLLAIAVLFGIFTFRPPELPLFLDPVSGRYGI